MSTVSSKPLIIANWKAGTLSYKEAELKILQTYKDLGSSSSKLELVFAPSAVHTHTLSQVFSKHLKHSKPKRTPYPKLTLAAQNISIHEGGSHTGELPVLAMKDAGVMYVIVGHSECRDGGDTNAIVITKTKLAIDNKLKVVLCVGERERDSGVQYLKIIEEQIVSVFSYIDKKDHGMITIAYEPVWAVNNKDNLSLDSHGLHSMVVFIKRLLLEKFGEETSKSVRILYGGSVTPENAQDVLWNGEVQGLLIGRASWAPESFVSIIKSVLINPKKNILKQYGSAKKHK